MSEGDAPAEDLGEEGFAHPRGSCDIVLYITNLLKTLPVARRHREFAGCALGS
jgi:hypothetical protein